MVEGDDGLDGWEGDDEGEGGVGVEGVGEGGVGVRCSHQAGLAPGPLRTSKSGGCHLRLDTLSLWTGRGRSAMRRVKVVRVGCRNVDFGVGCLRVAALGVVLELGLWRSVTKTLWLLTSRS